MITPPYLLLEIHELLDIFGLFLLVLLGIELISTLRTYLTENEVHVEVVFGRGAHCYWTEGHHSGCERTLKFDVDWHCLDYYLPFLWDTSSLKNLFRGMGP